jgi:hypothetical protein
MEDYDVVVVGEVVNVKKCCTLKERLLYGYSTYLTR